MDTTALRMFFQMVSMTVAFISGVYWLKWNDTGWVLVPMFIGPAISISVGLIGGLIAEAAE